MSHFHSATVVNVVDEVQISNKINDIVIKRGAWQYLQTVFIEECWFSGIFLPFWGSQGGYKLYTIWDSCENIHP